MSARVPTLGVLYRPDRLPEDLPESAREAEAAGFDELWVVEDCFLAGGLTMAASALAATERLAVGVGLLPAAVRNAAIVATAIAALARLRPGRLRVAFGHGVESWMRQIGARPPDRLVALEETVAAVRALLAGEELTVDGGHVRLDGVRLEQPPSAPPPVLIGTTGPRGLALASRVADGLLFPEGSGRRRSDGRASSWAPACWPRTPG
jgi:5,10-methylenetetrahydromethanopterin reductase